MPTRRVFVPPGGFAGFSQQTPAVQALLSGAAKPRRKKTTRKRRKVARKRPAAKRTRRATGRGRKPARLVKGSAAAKRHMAKLRAMRKKKTRRR